MVRQGQPGPRRYGCADPLLLRAAVRPVDSSGMTPGLDDLARVREAAADPLFAEAIALASPSLSHTLDSVAAERSLPAKDLRRAARAVARYRLRMSGRATPFGLMAGVAAAGFAADPELRWGTEHAKAVRVDMGWLSGVVGRLELDPAVLAVLRVTANDLCTVRGDRLVLPFVPAQGEQTQSGLQEVSLRHTEAVRLALRLAATPLGWVDLLKQLGAAYPGAETAAIERMLAELVRRDVLLTELRPPMDDRDPLAHVLALLAGYAAELPPESGHLVTELIAIQGELADYQATAPGRGRAALSAVTTRMRALYPAEQLIQLDLGLDVAARLPESVREEVERTAEVLATLTEHRPGPRHLRDYHAEFLERYGEGRAVPLLELLNPEQGLGAPAGYRTPLSARRAASEAMDDRDRLLLALAQQAAVAGERELVLDAELVAALGAAGQTPAEEAGPPPSFDLLAEVLADSVEAMAGGEFRLVLAGSSGVAGATAGRFGHLLGAAAERFGAVLRSVPTRNPQAVRAQLSFQAVRGKVANVAKVPRWLDHTITVSAFTDRAGEHALGLADLAVVADPQRLALISTALGGEVVPTMPSMLLTQRTAPNLARFLDEIHRSGEPQWPGWDWGAASELPFLPRVRHGRSVLAAARWRPTDPALRDPATQPADWQRRFTAWRDRMGVPEQVASVHSDHRITLDLRDPEHLDLLRHEWRNRPDAVLQELPSGGELGYGWSGGQPTEVAFALVRKAPGTAALRPVAPARARTVHAPGSSWLHAKLYCSTDRHNELLSRQLPFLLGELPQDVTRWFFLRYADPDPHLRLRFHGPAAVLGGELLPRLAAWAQRLGAQGHCGRLVLDSYEPELERYGGPAVMAQAEAAFQADSQACLEQLALIRDGGLPMDRRLLVAANYADLLHRLYGDPGGAGLLLAEESRESHRAAPVALRREARQLIDPLGGWHRLAEQPGGEALLTIWERRAAAVSAYGDELRLLGATAWNGERDIAHSLLHLHHNRLVGTDRKAERESLALLSLAVRAHADRERAQC
ncbi:thiopeptide-type bacteriocin biosynthesis protein [Kitasatospora sp. MAP12-15]|uniref:lantibiotic dehydratase n=1 Tax=unclassified Kitasatospora TaxID=2633591 RepID=UPI0024742C82|nr:lantibiotic dehydratase [Kitasatospora sp. MAP12-44]MDH6114793.1 thiopeptide-type bacteriocin biosynthesis protein [Kitasatospora sp. MAP12-44]